MRQRIDLSVVGRGRGRGGGAALWLPWGVASRGVVQSNKNTGLRSILDQYDDNTLVKKLRRNGVGNYYRYQQKLWPSLEALERDLTRLHYSAVERLPLSLLPRRDAPVRRFVCEGRGATTLLQDPAPCGEAEEEETQKEEEKGAEAPVGRPGDAFAPRPALSEDDAIHQKILTEADLCGTVLSSARAQTRALEGLQRDLARAGDAGGVGWGEGEGGGRVGLDPLLAGAAAALTGPSPTRLQTRLLPALLHEDHHDVLFNSATGSGKTTALLLAMLQGVRNESAGLNVLVAADPMNALRMYDTLHALCRHGGGGAMVDRPVGDFSWLLLGAYREEYEKYYQLLRRSLKGPHGHARIFITTADTFCELLFEKKMEFEDFGYLRRVYVDDIGVQIPMLSSTAPVREVRERLRNPLAAELLLGTLHQLPGPHIRSILQLGLVSADVDVKLKDHLKALCMKPSAQTVVLSPVRIPSTLHCLFSFYLYTENRYEYLVKLIWNARDTIPGRVIIFIRGDEDILQVRRTLRGLGMNAKIFSEVYGNGQFQEKWKFLLLRESEAFGTDIPLVSHIFVSFAPQSWQTFLHMSGRTGRLGNVGWVFTVTDKREAKHVRRVAEDLSVDFTHHVVDVNTNQVSPTSVHSFTKEPELFGMDPQYAVQQHYEVQAENPEMAYRSREFFSKPPHKQFQMEDYTPAATLQRRFGSASKLAKDVERNPSIVMDLARKGLVDDQLRPTKRLKDQMNLKTSKLAPSPFEKRR